MPRSASSIQAEINVLEAQVQSANSMAASVGSDGTTLTQAQLANLQNRLDKLYLFLDRANGTAPMIVRGVLRGLNGSPSR